MPNPLNIYPLRGEQLVRIDAVEVANPFAPRFVQQPGDVDGPSNPELRVVAEVEIDRVTDLVLENPIERCRVRRHVGRDKDRAGVVIVCRDLVVPGAAVRRGTSTSNACLTPS